jgi:hypothetical protein
LYGRHKLYLVHHFLAGKSKKRERGDAKNATTARKAL